MSGKENAAADDIAAHDDMGDPNQKDHLSGGTQTPSADVDYEDGYPRQNDELFIVTENLNQIEAILKAESKRRIEANRLSEEYIMDYLDKMESELNSRVIKQFHQMEKRI